MKTSRNWINFERYLALGSRFLTSIAIVGSLAGSILMFFLGLWDIVLAFSHGLPKPIDKVMQGSPGALAVIKVIEGLDRFLIGMVLLYFAYGVYSLFLRPERALKQSKEDLALPSWLRIREIGQLKQVVAEVILVILFVLFLRVALQVFQSPEPTMVWCQIATFLLLPLSILCLAISLRLVELHPKTPRSHE